jgi:hypothetical protein
MSRRWGGPALLPEGAHGIPARIAFHAQTAMPGFGKPPSSDLLSGRHPWQDKVENRGLSYMPQAGMPGRGLSPEASIFQGIQA